MECDSIGGWLKETLELVANRLQFLDVLVPVSVAEQAEYVVLVRGQPVGDVVQKPTKTDAFISFSCNFDTIRETVPNR